MGVHDEGRELPVGWKQRSSQCARWGELQVYNVELPCAEEPVQRWPQCRAPVCSSYSQLRVEAKERKLHQPPVELFQLGDGDQRHHLSAVGLHSPSALIGIEDRPIDQRHRRAVVASRQLGSSAHASALARQSAEWLIIGSGVTYRMLSHFRVISNT